MSSLFAISAFCVLAAFGVHLVFSVISGFKGGGR